MCPAETFEEKVWPETEAGQNATSSTGCPSGQVGGYLRECDTNSTWSSTVVDACCRYLFWSFSSSDWLC